jgi:alpha-1,4-digalacturonate transport system permease protein
MSESITHLLKFIVKRRYSNKMHWTDYFSYFYLCLGVLIMFGPVLWLGLSSFKSESAVMEYPPTVLPLSQKSIKIEGYKKNLLLFKVTLEDGSIKELAEI